MNKNITLEEALKIIENLKEENKQLKDELEYYKNRKTSGRKKHNAKWMQQYSEFVGNYEAGCSIVEIADAIGISERTAYRLKKYYEELKNTRLD